MAECVCGRGWEGADLRVCNGTEYETMAATLTSDRARLALTDCTMAEYELTPATLTSNRVCHALRVCNVSEYERAWHRL